MITPVLVAGALLKGPLYLKKSTWIDACHGTVRDVTIRVALRHIRDLVADAFRNIRNRYVKSPTRGTPRPAQKRLRLAVWRVAGM